MNRFRTSRSEVAYVDEGEGPPVLLLHGLGTSPSLWRGILPSLTARMRVIAPDLSDRDAEFDPRSWAACVRELLAHLEIEEIAVVGHGAGGLVAELLAIEGGVKCLVLIDAGPADSGGGQGPAHQPQSADLAALDMPTLVIWGEDDRFLPVDLAERLADALPHSTLVLLPGCGHFLPEEAPDTVAPLVAEFLRARYLQLPHAHDHAGAGGPIPIELHRTSGTSGTRGQA
jgi:pimeloyl-ACP methyl ester carboxylesterase